jgi:2-polyprenyl-3-methyl-5-hydroxy-6-metoxy-1,4-benzoquinol methylase
MSDYRSQMYDQYVTGFRDRPLQFDSAAAVRWARPYEYYFRGWLPSNPDARIVDLACGDGQLLFSLKQHGFRNLRGVDISAEQVALAQQAGTDVVRQDVFDFLEATPDNSLDLILALDLIEHLHKGEALQLLRNCASKLAAGGRLILQTPNADSPWCDTIRYGDFTHETCYTPNLLGRLLAMHSFVDIRAREMGPVPLGRSVKSTVRFLGWRCIRAGLMLYNALETGSAGNGVLTRVFCISGVKRPDSSPPPVASVGAAGEA